jgi:DNA-directed RNA polymerase subunit N (RpoN/RPB10)
MSCYILCPECGNDLGCVYPAFKCLQAAHNKLYCESEKNIHSSKIDIKSSGNKGVGYILDTLNLNNMCCRMHLISHVDFDNIYKWY